MSKILITGGAGFIGSHLAEKLLEKGEEIFVVDNLSTGTLENINHLQDNKKFHFIEGSILDEKLMAEVVGKIEKIYHLAAAVGVRQILGKPLKSLLTNIKGTEIILKEAAKRKVHSVKSRSAFGGAGAASPQFNRVKVLITSSSEVCGKGDNMPFREDDDRSYGSVYNDRWVYAFSKGVDEFLGLAYWREKRLPVIIIRLFNVIGPRQTGFYGMVVPTFVQQALKNEPITVFGDGEQTRCFADVDDLVEALIKLMQENKAEGQVINLGSDKEISINQLAKKVKDLTDSSSQIVHIPYKEAYPEGYEDFRRRVPDLTKIKELIGYQPQFYLEESIKKIIRYHET